MLIEKPDYALIMDEKREFLKNRNWICYRRNSKGFKEIGYYASRKLK